MQTEDMSIVPSVCDKEHDTIDAQVACLQGDAALERLDVVEMRFGLDENVTVHVADHCVSGPPFASYRHRDLNSPAERVRNPGSQPLK